MSGGGLRRAGELGEVEPMATREELLGHLETLDHGRRMADMVEFGRRAAADPSAAAARREVEAGTAYERRLAAQSCHGSRDGGHVLRALKDPSALVSRLAMKLVPVVCDDGQVRAALDAAAPKQRSDLLARLVRRGRSIDDFLDHAARVGVDADLARLLPFGSRACVARHLDRFVDAADYPAWARLARHHPDAAAAVTERRAAAADRLDARLVWQANAVLSRLADERPELALRLVRVLARHAPLERLALQNLARRLPDDIADLVLSTEDRACVSFAAVAHRLEAGRLRALVDRRPDALGSPQSWLRRLPPARRAEFYGARPLAWRGADGAIEDEVVALLPRDAREPEGRRHLALPALSTRPRGRLPYASFLPWEEALAALEAPVRSPDPELRATAVSAIVGCARFHPDRLNDLIAFVLARRNEQDPVRMAAVR